MRYVLTILMLSALFLSCQEDKKMPTFTDVDAAPGDTQSDLPTDDTEEDRGVAPDCNDHDECRDDELCFDGECVDREEILADCNDNDDCPDGYYCYDEDYCEEE